MVEAWREKSAVACLEERSIRKLPNNVHRFVLLVLNRHGDSFPVSVHPVHEQISSLLFWN